MSDENGKTALELANELITLLGENLNTEIETQLRALHARDGVHFLSLAVAFLAIGHATTRGLEMSPEAGVALQIAGSIVGMRIKTLTVERAAELSQEERAIARRLGARIPVVGKA